MKKTILLLLLISINFAYEDFVLNAHGGNPDKLKSSDDELYFGGKYISVSTIATRDQLIIDPKPELQELLKNKKENLFATFFILSDEIQKLNPSEIKKELGTTPFNIRFLQLNDEFNQPYGSELADFKVIRINVPKQQVTIRVYSKVKKAPKKPPSKPKEPIAQEPCGYTKKTLLQKIANDENKKFQENNAVTDKNIQDKYSEHWEVLAAQGSHESKCNQQKPIIKVCGKYISKSRSSAYGWDQILYKHIGANSDCGLRTLCDTADDTKNIVCASKINEQITTNIYLADTNNELNENEITQIRLQSYEKGQNIAGDLVKKYLAKKHNTKGDITVVRDVLGYRMDYYPLKVLCLLPKKTMKQILKVDLTDDCIDNGITTTT